MLDSDLAEIYGYTIKAFNQQVQRNIEKFDGDFMFRLAYNEIPLSIRSKILTGSHRNERFLPYAFTESGIYMLMTVLKGPLAIKQSIMLIRLFKGMKDTLNDAGNKITTIIEINDIKRYTQTIRHLLNNQKLNIK